MRTFYLFIFLLIFSNVNAQFFEKLSIDAHFGGRSGGTHSPGSTLKNDIHFDGGLLYKIDSLIYIRGGLSFDKFKTTKDNSIDNALLIGLSIQLVAEIMPIQSGSSKFGLNFHTGFWLSTMYNPNYKVGKEFNDPGIKGNDDMINVIIGLTPRYKINYKISINLDLVTTALLKQNSYVDMEFDSKANNKPGSIINIAIGATYKF